MDVDQALKIVDDIMLAISGVCSVLFFFTINPIFIIINFLYLGKVIYGIGKFEKLDIKLQTGRTLLIFALWRFV